MQQVNKSYAIKLLLFLLLHSQAIMVFTEYNQRLPQEFDGSHQELSQMETEKFELKNLLQQQLLLNSLSLQAPSLPASKLNSATNNKQFESRQVQDLRSREYDNVHANIDNDDVYGDDEENDDDDVNSFSYNAHENSFYDHYGNGAYAYGYSLPQGVRRFERGYYPSGQHEGNSMIIEGFYTQLRDLGNRKLYELRCYNADNRGYRPMRVQYLSRPPVVRRHILPDVNCFDNNI